MQRIPHNNTEVWLKEFKTTKKSLHVKKHSKDLSSFLNITRNSDQDIPFPQNLTILFGQQLVPIRNLELITKLYFDYDITINPAGSFTTYSDKDLGIPLPLQEDWFSLCDLFSLQKDVNFDTPLPENWYTLELGYSKVPNLKSNLGATNNNETIASRIFADMDESCFEWLPVTNGMLELPDEEIASGALIIDYRLTVNASVLNKWIADVFSDRIDLINSAFGSNSFDLTFMLYPPSYTGLQIEDLPSITKPSGIVKTKVIREVEFEVKQSFVNNSQKVFELYFVDSSDGSVLFGENSIEGYRSFFLNTPKGQVPFKKLPLELSTAEQLTDFAFPTSKFTVTYKIPDDVVKFLSNHLNYTILLKMSDLTSERRQ